MTTQCPTGPLARGRDVSGDPIRRLSDDLVRRPSDDLLRQLSDDDLLRRTTDLTRRSRHTEAALLAHLGEIDARRLYLREACSSLFAYCTERLHFSGGEAFFRMAAARAAREHPVILEMLADGRLHLTAVALLAPHLTAANRDTVLDRAVHRSKREVQELVAELKPRPDVPSLIRKLPTRADPLRAAAASAPPAASPLPPGAPAALGLWPADVDRPDSPVSPELAALPAPLLAAALPAPLLPAPLLPGPLMPPLLPPPPLPRNTLAATPPHTPMLEPLAPGRYRIQFTAGQELRDKLERLRSLMRSTVPDGDLATIIGEAVTEKLARLERRRFAATERPRKSLAETDVTPSSRHVPAAVRRAVSARDGAQCAYRDAQDRRCTAQVWLELHHRHPYGLGGDHAVRNVALLCHAHNRFLEEVDFGTPGGG